jgi:hypothetical protein
MAAFAHQAFAQVFISPSEPSLKANHALPPSRFQSTQHVQTSLLHQIIKLGCVLSSIKYIAVCDEYKDDQHKIKSPYGE